MKASLGENCPITAVVFDVGQVLYKFSLSNFEAFLEEHGYPRVERGEFIRQARVLEHERGTISNEDFLNGVRSLLTKDASLEEITRWWTHIFWPNEEMLSLARAIGKRMPIFMLSNTNSLHWDYLRRAHDIEALAKGRVLSFETGHLKPELEIFYEAEQAFGLEAAKSVFIDDIEENVLAARKLGWHAVRHKTAEATKKALQELGVVLE